MYLVDRVSMSRAPPRARLTLTSKEHNSIPAATYWIASTAPTLFFVAATRALRAEILSSAAWDWSPYRCSEDKASKERRTAAADDVLLARAMRMRILPTLLGSCPKVVSELEAMHWTVGDFVSFRARIGYDGTRP